VGIFSDGIEENKDVPALGNIKIADVGRAEVYDFLNSLPFRGQTKAHYRAQIHSLFEYARQREWIEENPVAQLGRVKKKEKGASVRILTVPEAEELLERAQQSPFSRVLVPRLVFGLFLGLRPSETNRLDWEDVDFNKRDVKIRNENKTSQERYVDLNPTAYAWLRKYRGVGRVEKGSDGQLRKAWDRLRRACGWNLTLAPASKKDWVTDILRHSYGSYLLGVIGDNKEKVSALMGNSVSVLRKHYRRAISEHEAKPYWKLLPESFSPPKPSRQKKIKDI
jgi:integrase